MARSSLKSLLLLIFLLFIFILSVNQVEARNPKNLMHRSSIDTEVTKILGELYVEAIKTGGPSHGGDGHAFTNSFNSDGIKNSGPNA